jgi:ribosomal protein S20
MPVTKTAKRALRGAERKLAVNKAILKRFGVAVRRAKKTKSKDKILEAISLADKAAKKRAIHKNKAARIKSSLSKLLPRGATTKKKTTFKPKKAAKPLKKK